LLVAATMVVAACSSTLADTNEVAPGVLQIGVIENPDIQESSGIIPARGNRGAYWTHNDSGLDFVYAITADGTSLGQRKIKDVDMQNIEDIARGAGRLYLADIGNNTGDRDQVAVYAIPEPPVRGTGDVHVVRSWQLTYPGKPFDSESFFVWRTFGYLISKELNSGDARLYRFPLNKRGATFELEGQAKLNVNDQTRGADITPDGKRLAVITGTGAYLFTFTKGIPSSGTLEPTGFVEFHHQSMEGCCFTRNGLVVTSESRDLFLFTDPMFRYPAPRNVNKGAR
jgi:hypothetical protein